MALIKCPECKKKISDQCESCPNCGYPIKNSIEAKSDHCVECVAESNPAEKLNEKTKKKDPKIRKPINKKVLITLLAAVAMLLIVGGIAGYKALLPRINATKDFKEAVATVEEKNLQLDAAVKESEDLILEKQPLLDESLISALEKAISDAKAAKELDFQIPNNVEEIIIRTEMLYKIDYTPELANLSKKHDAVVTDTTRYQLVNQPTEAYVIQCLQTIPEIVNISAVTEDNDPNGNLNKAGGYTATVYFAVESINLDKSIYGSTLIEQGTDAGGGIEVYSCVEDAIKRRDYLATFDGGIFASGTHTVIGTVLVRTSNELTASQQKALEARIIAALTYLPNEDAPLNVETDTSVLAPETDTPKTNNTEVTADTAPEHSTEPTEGESIANDEPVYASIVGTYQGTEVNMGSVTATFYSDGTLSVVTSSTSFTGTWTQSYNQAHFTLFESDEFEWTPQDVTVTSNGIDGLWGQFYQRIG